MFTSQAEAMRRGDARRESARDGINIHGDMTNGDNLCWVKAVCGWMCCVFSISFRQRSSNCGWNGLFWRILAYVLCSKSLLRRNMAIILLYLVVVELSKKIGAEARRESMILQSLMLSAKLAKPGTQRLSFFFIIVVIFFLSIIVPDRKIILLSSTSIWSNNTNNNSNIKH